MTDSLLGRRDLADGRSIFLYRQIFNWKLVIGVGDYVWDEAY